MSTRCNVIIKDAYSEVLFYRHSDGYPEGVEDSIKTFLRWVEEGKIRRNTSQASGWLILLGAMEYSTLPVIEDPKSERFSLTEEQKAFDPPDWKCGAYEPTSRLASDREYLHVIDLDTVTWRIDGVDGYQYQGRFGRVETEKVSI